MSGVPCPPEPLAPESFGWVYSGWVKLLKQAALAEGRLARAASDAERTAAGYAVEMARDDLAKFRRETAEGFLLALKFAAEQDPARLYGYFAQAVRDEATSQAAEYRGDLASRMKRVEAENAELKAELAELRGGVRVLLEELGALGVRECRG
jgi:hypothetical protein